MTRNLLILLFLFFSVNAKPNPTDSIPAEKKAIRLPIVTGGIGMLNFNGDVGYSKLNEPLFARSGFHFEIQPYTENRVSFSLFFLSGKMIGEEKTVSRAVNFKTSLFAEGFNVRYDFLSKKRSDQILVPYLTVGIEYLTFTSKSDLLDANGVAYQYWNDGTIRNISQDAPNADQASMLYRDYTYETDLRDANLDGFGNFSTSTWGVPVGGGVRFRVSDRCSFHISSVCHFTGTDYIDGITSEGKDERKGNSKNDKFFYSSLAFRFSLGTTGGNEMSKVDFAAIANDDADGDGIPDLKDDSSGTPENNQVTEEGKPLDTDKDGIPDYRDLEANSAIDAVVTEQGVTITEAMIEEKFRKDSLEALPAVIEYLKSYDKLLERNPDVEKKWIEKNSAGVSPTKNQIPTIYRPLDLDKNGIITPREIGLAIDDYLAKKTSYSVSEFFDLIDYFFSQN